MKKLMGIMLCLLLAGCSVKSDEARNMPISSFREDSYLLSESSKDMELITILNKQEFDWRVNDYLLILNTSRELLYSIAGTDKPNENYPLDFDYKNRYYIESFGSSWLGFSRSYGQSSSFEDTPVYVRMSPEGMTVKDVLNSHEAADIIEILLEDTRPSGGTGYYTYHVFCHETPLIYVYHLKHYGASIPKQEQMKLEVAYKYILLEETPLINKQGVFLYPDLDTLI